MSENSKINKIYKSREILLEIFEQHGYNTGDYSGFSVTEVHSLLRNDQLDLLLTKQTDEKKLYIKYYLDKGLKPNTIHDMVEDLYHISDILTKKDDLIIVVKDEPNDTLCNLQRHIYNTDGIFITIINVERLQFNILKHKLVPKHMVLTDDEKSEVKEIYNIIDDKRFPEISRFDPVAQILCLRPGQLCKIIRASKTSIFSDFYRICSQ